MPMINTQLAESGPVISTYVNLSMVKLAAMQRANEVSPPPLLVRGLIDTGASCSAIDKEVARRLSLEPTGSVQIFTPSTGAASHDCNEYDISVWLPQNPTPTQPCPSLHPIHLILSVIESDFSARQIEVLIGRDVLAKCLLVYNGLTGQITLAY
jgi:predicted aspartyl protease